MRVLGRVFRTPIPGIASHADRSRRLLRAGVEAALLVALLSACGASTATVPAHATTRPTATVQPTSITQLDDAALEKAKRDYAPTRLIIAKMGLNAQIIGLGPDANGAMQAPRGKPSSDPIWREVYWWNVGAYPGQIGNAVIAGHVNRPDYGPSTFTYLNRLVPGDTIIVETANLSKLTFVVREKTPVSAYVTGASNPVINDIFGPSLTPELNLLTCYGEWDGAQFNQRLLVRAVLVGASPFPTAAS